MHSQDVGAADDMGADFNAQEDDDEGEVYFGEEAAMQEVDQAYVDAHAALRSVRTCTFVLAWLSRRPPTAKTLHTTWKQSSG